MSAESAASACARAPEWLSARRQTREIREQPLPTRERPFFPDPPQKKKVAGERNAANDSRTSTRVESMLFSGDLS